MKQRIQWIAALFTAASAGLAIAGPGPYSYGTFNCPVETVRIEPVREMIVQPQYCAVERPLVVRESTCLVEPRRTLDWGAPFRTVGRVVSTPFVALGSSRYIEPVGERLTTYSTVSTRRWSHKRTMLMPVGERFTTVKIIRSKKLQPVGERFIVKKHHKKMLKPVGERLITVKKYHKTTMLLPVGERFTTVKFCSKPLLEPVGEKITTIKYVKMAPVLEPVGERTIIRTTRIYSQPWWCD